MSKYFSIIALYLVLLIGVITSAKFNCNVTKKDNKLTCECSATGGSEARASGGSATLRCDADKDYCSSEAQGLPNGKVFIAFCTQEVIGLVQKQNDKYIYSEINNLSVSQEDGASKASGSIDSEKKDSINIYKRFFRKLRKLL